ncbi:uncharacterized protein BX663DRAFT_528698 [Cokeromyces recurvatus]|uniref:uncharacterized protein n=1 Tax=Cokeromyces recurvatus TaxID=90255 RepID=UPI0022201A37|nr:uncharacterized protein BX663DRAFT_528698 [Cokeromyces recurvatus]KAI7908204.1 hypothetical protein BX663DRAFT_528698 [Cokeromyces recurvatus]
MSFWWGQSAIDELVEKATSEFLPAGQVDLALHLEISDHIRSKKVTAKDAMRSLKQRLHHKNPNVILATLSLVDTCVKNSGPAFVKEVATRDFMEEMTHFLRIPTGCNHDVKEKVLYLIQVWGIASKGNSSLSYIFGTYQLLRAEGYRFPPVTEKIDPILLETAVAPDWTDSDCCERCRTAFTLTNRKHHCRHCGQTFCQQCSSKSLPLPHLGMNDIVRVCDGCYIKVKLAKVADKVTVPKLLGISKPASISSSLTPNYTPSIKHKFDSNNPATSNSISNTINNSVDKQFEDDLKKAIELSLKESEQPQKKVSFNYDNHFTSSVNYESSLLDTTNKKSQEEEEEDIHIAAAIAASLEDMKLSSKSHPYSTIQQDTLSITDIENIQTFSTLIQHIYSTGSDASKDTQISHLYSQIGAYQPKLVEALNQVSQKHDLFVDIHTKLNKAVKAYDKLNYATTQHIARTSYPTYYINQAQQQPQFSSTISANSFSSYPPASTSFPLQQQQTTYSQHLQTPIIQPHQQQQVPITPIYQQPQAPNHSSLPYPYSQQQTCVPQEELQTLYHIPSTANNKVYYKQQPVDEAPLIEL